jgi:hypothetical protein
MKWSIDVSGYDARRYSFPAGYIYDLPTDWKKARDEGGLSLAIIKCSEGNNYTDRAFRMQWAAAKGILPRLAYHFFRANINAIQQANYVKTLLSYDFDPKTDFVAMDFETTDGMTGQQTLMAGGSFLYEIEKMGTMPFIYSGWTWREIGGETNGLWAKKYPLWLASWPLDNWIANTAIQLPPYLFDAAKLADFKNKIATGAIKPNVPKPWTIPAIWQFTARADTRFIPGHPAVKTAADYNAIYIDVPVIGTTPTHPAVCPTCGQAWT